MNIGLSAGKAGPAMFRMVKFLGVQRLYIYMPQ